MSAPQVPYLAPERPAPIAPPLNPWLSIWFQPRRTIRQIVETRPQEYVLLIAAVAGIGSVLDKAELKSLGDKLSLPAIFGLAVTFGPIGGIIGLYLWGFLLRVTGSWLGGHSDSENLRAAIAWPRVIILCGLPLMAVQLALIGRDVFTSESPTIDAHPILLIPILAMLAVAITLNIWWAVVSLKCIGEVQGFSAWRALASAVLALLILMAAVLVLIAPCVLIAIMSRAKTG